MQVDGFSELASASLPSLAQDFSNQPSWSRSLSVLRAESEALRESCRSNSQSGDGRTLLGDQTQFGRLAANLASAKPSMAPTDPYCTVEDLLRKNRNAILDGVLAEERERTSKETERRVEAQIQEDWESEREWWMEEIIGKNYVGGSALKLKQSDRPEIRDHTNQQPSLPALSYQASTSTESLLAEVGAESIESHLGIVQDSIDSDEPIEQVLAKFESMSNLTTSQQGYYYGVAWQLLSCMFSKRSASPIERAMGALEHLCKQFQKLVINRVHSANPNQQQPGDMFSTVAKFVELEFGAHSSFWHLVYFCLRCGDAVTAKKALQFAKAGEVEQIISNTIESLSRRQGSMACLWEVGAVGVPFHDNQALSALFDSMTSSDGKDIYKLGSLALLCGNRPLPSSDNAQGFGTVEDYLFGCLWRVTHASNPSVAVSELGEHIRSFSSQYFNEKNTGGWSSALPLIASQQFASALVCLANEGKTLGLFHAAHVGLAILVTDPIVGDLGDQKPNNRAVSDIIVAYASSLRSSGPNGSIPALLYLLRVPEKNRSRREIAALASNSYGVGESLCGELLPDGVRENAILDRYMSHSEASNTIAEAAEQVHKVAEDRVKAQQALTLFMLAGRYSSVVQVLNQLMSPCNEVSSDRTFWRQQAEQFYAAYLSKRTFILESLEREDKRHLVEMNRVLAQLCLSFENLSLKRTDECWSIIRALDFLPKSSDDIAGKVTSARDFDRTLRDIFPALLKGAMECLYVQYRDLKNQSAAKSPTSTVRLSKLREQGRLLSTFAGLLGVDRDSSDILSRFEAHMA